MTASSTPAYAAMRTLSRVVRLDSPVPGKSSATQRNVARSWLMTSRQMNDHMPASTNRIVGPLPTSM
jgi:hypothetical protein